MRTSRNTRCCPATGGIGSIWEDRDRRKGWGWALGVGTPFDPDKVKTNGYVGSLEEAKRQFQNTWTSWLEWADLQGAAGLIRGPNDYRCSSSSSAWRFSPLSPQGLSDRGRSGFWRLGLL
jgi:hypothetical protein